MPKTHRYIHCDECNGDGQVKVFGGGWAECEICDGCGCYEAVFCWACSEYRGNPPRGVWHAPPACTAEADAAFEARHRK